MPASRKLTLVPTKFVSSFPFFRPCSCTDAFPHAVWRQRSRSLRFEETHRTASRFHRGAYPPIFPLPSASSKLLEAPSLQNVSTDSSSPTLKQVESRLGTGSIFSFSIPAQRASPPSTPVVSPPAVSGLAMAPTARPKRPNSSAGADGNKPSSFAKRPLTSPVIESTKASKTTRMSPVPMAVDASGPPRILVVEVRLFFRPPPFPRRRN